jgi:hypothetical protein
LKEEPKKEVKHEPHARAPPIKFDPQGVEYIDLSADTPPKAERRGKRASALIIPPLSVPGFRGGAAEEERQHINQKIADRSRQTGIDEAPANITFSIGLSSSLQLG